MFSIHSPLLTNIRPFLERAIKEFNYEYISCAIFKTKRRNITTRSVKKKKVIEFSLKGREKPNLVHWSQERCGNEPALPASEQRQRSKNTSFELLRRPLVVQRHWQQNPRPTTTYPIIKDLVITPHQYESREKSYYGSCSDKQIKPQEINRILIITRVTLFQYSENYEEKMPQINE